MRTGRPKTLRPCKHCGDMFGFMELKRHKCPNRKPRCPIGTAMDLIREMISQKTTACIEWPYARYNGGYGQVHVPGEHRKRPTSVIAWKIVHGYYPPPGMKICHKCDNPPCFNPEHLFMGTDRDNKMDSIMKGRSTKGEEFVHARIKASYIPEILAIPRKSSEELAAKFGCSRAAINQVRRGKTWTWVKEPDFELIFPF